MHDAHAASASAKARLDHQREADASGRSLHLCGIRDGVLGTRDGGNAGGNRQLLGRRLVAEGFEVIGSRPDELDASILAGARERGIFREESVARMDAVHPL